MFALCILIACFLAAAWPLLNHPRVRPLLAGALGSTCLATGTVTFGLLAGGLVQMPAFAAEAHAADAALPSDKPLPPTSDPKASTDPQIEVSSPDQVIIPPGRPDWVEQEPNLNGDIHTVPVSSGPFYHETECNRALDKELVKATREYIVDQLGNDLATQFIRYDARTIKDRLVKKGNTYHEVITVTFGPMHQVHALLEFDPKFRKELEKRWTKVRGASRLGQLGFFAVSGLGLIASIFGYFRLDNATRGYYTGRLQFMTAAAILAIVGAGAIAAQWITWL